MAKKSGANGAFVGNLTRSNVGFSTTNDGEYALFSAHVHRDNSANSNLVRLLRRIDDRGLRENLVDLGDTSLDHALLVFRIVIFGVLGNVAEFASNLDALANLGALLGFEVMQLLLELLAALGSKDVIATHFVTPNFKIDSAAKRRPFTKTGTQCVLV